MDCSRRFSFGLGCRAMKRLYWLGSRHGLSRFGFLRGLPLYLWHWRACFPLLGLPRRTLLPSLPAQSACHSVRRNARNPRHALPGYHPTAHLFGSLLETVARLTDAAPGLRPPATASKQLSYARVAHRPL
jgi:hypothetical protein